MAREYSKHEEALEIKSLRRIISAYLNYADAAEEDVKRYERSYKKLSAEHKALLSHMPVKFQRLRRCISINAFFIMNMLQAFEPPFDMSHDIDVDDGSPENFLHGHCHSETVPYSASLRSCSEKCMLVGGSEECVPELSSFKQEDKQLCASPERTNENEEIEMKRYSQSMASSVASEHHKEVCNGCGGDAQIVADSPPLCCGSCPNGNLPPSDWLDSSLQLKVPLVDVDKVRCIIRNIVRDWASEGQRERDQCYKPILEELDRLFPHRSKEMPPCCLVPGAGLGRLALEISSLGFISQGNEFSYYMMICSSFILNHTQIPGEWTIYPWLHSNCNSLSDNDQLRPISFPDIHPASAGITEGFSMCGGDFVEVYSDRSQEASWDAVVTCFFLDTAHNIVEYIEILSKILKEGGVWINLGPLLYHFAEAYGADDEMSIELSLEDLKKVAFHYGFELEKEETIETTYTANPRAMMQNRYFAAFWTMKKKSRT